MGVRPTDFWDLTFAEIAVMYKGRARTRKYNENLLLATAWHIGRFAQWDIKRYPKLESILIKDTPKQQTGDQMLEIAKIINAAVGGEVVET